MKILCIAFKYDYGDPRRGFSLGHYHFYDALANLYSHRYQVIYFPFDEIMRKVGRDAMNKQLIETIQKEKPDLCFFFLSTDEIRKETVREITRSSKTITLNWFFDDHWRFDNFSKHWAPLFDWVVTTDPSRPKQYSYAGFKNVILSQYGCNPFVYKPFSVEKRYDVTFIGQPHGERKEIIQNIRDAGIQITCWGRGWPNGRVSQEDMIKIFSESKINLNLTKSSHVGFIRSLARILLRRRGVDKSVHFEPPWYWIDNIRTYKSRRRQQIKSRNFEIPGCGAFLLTGPADHLEEYYVDGKEIVVFRDTNDLIEKIRYYLEHDDEREKIARAGYERTLYEHTYQSRFKKIFETIGLIP